MPRFCCPHCHTPSPVEGFDRAFATDASYLVCPECDYTFLSLLVARQAGPSTPDPNQHAEDRQPCLQSS